MKPALRCLGYVALGVAGAIIAAVILFGCIGCLSWLSDASTRYFELPDKYSILFLCGYFVLIAGGFVGVSLCRENRL